MQFLIWTVISLLVGAMAKVGVDSQAALASGYSVSSVLGDMVVLVVVGLIGIGVLGSLASPARK